MNKIFLITITLLLANINLFAQEELPLNSIAPNFYGIDDKNNNIELKKLVNNGPVVVVFYRGKW